MELKNQAAFSYDEMFVSTESMRRYFRLLGLVPFVRRMEDGGYGFRWRRWQPLMWGQALGASVFAVYSTFADFVAFMPGAEMERHVVRACALIFLLGVLVNLSCFALNAPSWPRFFRRWARLDAALDVRCDPRLRRGARMAVTAFTAYVLLLLLMSALTGLWLLLRPRDIFIGPTYPLALSVYALHWNVCLNLPDVFVVFVCWAVCSRLKMLRGRMSAAFERRALWTRERAGTLPGIRKAGSVKGGTDRVCVGGAELSEEVELWRLAYQLLMDSVAHVNGVFGPFLLTSCVVQALTLPLVIYTFVQLGQTNLTVRLLQMSVFASNITRVAIMCVVGQRVHDQIAEVSVVLRDAPSSDLSESTNHEISFFLNCTRLSPTKISAWGFLDVDIGYLQSVLGVIVVYTITIMQFQMAACPSANNATNNITNNATNYGSFNVSSDVS